MQIIERGDDDFLVQVSDDRQTVEVAYHNFSLSFPLHLTRALSGLLYWVAQDVDVEIAAQTDPFLGKALRIELKDDISVKTLQEWVKIIEISSFSLGSTLKNVLTHGPSLVTYPNYIHRLLEWSYSNPNNPFVMSIENAPL